MPEIIQKRKCTNDDAAKLLAIQFPNEGIKSLRVMLDLPTTIICTVHVDKLLVACAAFSTFTSFHPNVLGKPGNRTVAYISHLCCRDGYKGMVFTRCWFDTINS
eukprot:GHVT01037442.1.p3 GENE.GHVT01037442.1~~GHVT01037442.1.p3  ORF type:complete len:104 (+),score=3.45 GHVT01037442.1:1423-1734(+)